MSVQPAQPMEAMLDAEGRVAVNAPCVSCGYNLRTLKTDALCPECAQPVAFSIQGYFLRFAEPRWVHGLARGLVLVLVALGGMIILEPLLSTLLTVPVMVGAAAPTAADLTELVYIIAGVQFAVRGLLVALGIIGLLSVTGRNPSDTGPELVRARRIARFCSFLLPIPIVISLVIVLCLPDLQLLARAGTLPAAAPASLHMLLAFGYATGLVGGAVYAITALALLRHLISLMKRVPRPGLARFAQVEFWGLLITAALFLAGYTLIAVTIIPTLGSFMAAATSMPTTAPAGVASTSYSYSVGVWPGGSATQPPTATTTATATRAPGTPPALLALGYAAPTSGPAASLPTTLPALPPPGFFTMMMLAGGASAAGGCGSLVFGVAAVVLMIMAASALFKAAREAESNAGEALLKSSGPRAGQV